MDVEKDLSPNERLERAHDLAISAFLADSIYNFGELVCVSHVVHLNFTKQLLVDAPNIGRTGPHTL